MRDDSARWLPVAGILVVALASLATSTVAPPALAGVRGLLKLKVQDCYGSSWLSGASVDVTIYRPGVGTVDSGSGTTNSSGYVEIEFDDLEDGDEAHVIVTPADESPASNHTYYWVDPEEQRPSVWDIDSFGDAPCPDGWYDESANIILCVHS